MKQAVYEDDMYLKELDSVVDSVNGKYIVLKQTIFYPNAGGVLYDTGKILRKKDNKVFNVIFSIKKNNVISHEVDVEGLNENDEVKLILDWDRRYHLMKSHTVAHLLSSLFHKEGALITGNSIELEKSRMDFNLKDFSKELVEKKIEELNNIIKNDGVVEVYYIDREEALKNEGFVKLANKLPPNIEKLRIVKIVDKNNNILDEQADGGCHVKHLNEIKKVELLKVDNKGKGNRRVYFKVE